MESIDVNTIPVILQNASLDEERPWTLEKMRKLLSISYKLTAHPFLRYWRGHEPVDLFDLTDFDAEKFKRFNRTIIERTISQSDYYSQVKSEYGTLSMRSKGIEYAIMNVENFYLTANKLYNSSESECSYSSTAIHYFRLTGPGELKAAISYFMTVCNDMIALKLKHSISEMLNKITVDEERVKWLLRTKTNLQQQKDQFQENVFNNVMDMIEIELGYHKQVKEYMDIPADLKEIVTQFLAEKKARISNNKLLGFLIEEKLQEFCSGLSELVMELFSYHDIGTQEPEKVYHAFLLGVLNSFKDIYKMESNKEAGNGRFDILLTPETMEYKGIIIEIKRSATDDSNKIDSMLGEALSQIANNKYATVLKSLGHEKYIALAAVFYGKNLFLKYRVDTIS